MRNASLTAVVVLTMFAQAAPAGALPASQERFWKSLRKACGKAFEGRVVEAPPGDTVFTGRRLVMHVRTCGPDSMRIPFMVGEDRSRTWVLHRTARGLRLKHDHRHEDGHPDSITWYGGDTAAPGMAESQEFPADSFTAALIPRAANNIWRIEVVAGKRFVYALRRIGTDRRYRVEFDLTRPVAAPPPPWGAPQP